MLQQLFVERSQLQHGQEKPALLCDICNTSWICQQEHTMASKPGQPNNRTGVPANYCGGSSLGQSCWCHQNIRKYNSIDIRIFVHYSPEAKENNQ